MSACLVDALIKRKKENESHIEILRNSKSSAKDDLTRGFIEGQLLEMKNENEHIKLLLSTAR